MSDFSLLPSPWKVLSPDSNALTNLIILKSLTNTCVAGRQACLPIGRCVVQIFLLDVPTDEGPLFRINLFKIAEAESY